VFQLSAQNCATRASVHEKIVSAGPDKNQEIDACQPIAGFNVN
jgi:hypothetical protein